MDPQLDGSNRPRVVLVLPAYNEAHALAKILPSVGAVPRLTSYDFSVLVVDDGSTDQTAAVIAQYRDHGVDGITRQANRGFGEALNDGLSKALEQADIVVTMDADDTHDVLLIPTMVESIVRGASDLVVASRYVPGSRQVGVPFLRRMLSRVGNGFVSLLLGRIATDISSNFRAYNASVLRRIADGDRYGRLATESGFAAAVELLLRAVDAGARISEIPFHLHYDRKVSPSAMRIGNTLVRVARLLLTEALRSRHSGANSKPEWRTDASISAVGPPDAPDSETLNA